PRDEGVPLLSRWRRRTRTPPSASRRCSGSANRTIAGRSTSSRKSSRNNPASLRALQSVPVDDVLGELGELLVGLPFLVERLLQELGNLRQTEQARVCARRAVTGDLVVLDLLRGLDQAGVEHLIFQLINPF